MSTDYNAATWTASDLLTDVYRACRMPDTGTVDYTSSVVLRMASDAIWDWAGHKISGARDGRSLAELNRVVTSGAITSAGDAYELPPMAVADAIELVEWVSGSNARKLRVIPRGMETVDFAPSNSGDPEAYALVDGVVRVYPRVVSNSGGTLRITYQRRHGELVVGSDTSVVVSVANNGGYARVTMTSTPSSFVANAWIDFIGKYLPYRYKITGSKITTAHGSNEFTLSTTYTEFVAATLAGDTAVVHGKTPNIHIPLEFRGPLTQHISAKILAELGDVQLAGVQDSLATAGGNRAMDMMSPRTKAQRAKLFNPFSLARMGIRRSQRGEDTR